MRRYSILPVLTGCLLAVIIVVLAYAGPDSKVSKPEPPLTLIPIHSLVEGPGGIPRIDPGTSRTLGSFDHYPSHGTGTLTYHVDAIASGAGWITTTVESGVGVIMISPSCQNCPASVDITINYTGDPLNGVAISQSATGNTVVGQSLAISRLMISLVR